jgi:hypothetical protein
MPDIQTELQKILQAWETPEPIETTETNTEEPMFNPTTNTSRATFDIVRDQPGLTRNDYVRLLVKQGHKKSSTSSLLAQMLRQGHIWKDATGTLRPNQTEYKPLKSYTTIKNKAKKVKPAKSYKVITSGMPKPSADALAAAEEAMGGINVLIDRPVRSKIDTILDDISLSDAHELYRQLHKYFGGLPK